MVTKIVGFGDKFCNIFTKAGRKRNSIYREIQSGAWDNVVIRQRKLPDKSRAIYASEIALLGYTIDNFYKVNPDASVEKRTTQKSTSFFTNVIREKLSFNSKGENVKETKIFTEYNIVSKLHGRTKKSSDKTRSVSIEEGNLVNICDRLRFGKTKICKIKSKTNSDYYQFTQYKDGKREYEKSINGVNYSFTAEPMTKSC